MRWGRVRAAAARAVVGGCQMRGAMAAGAGGGGEMRWRACGQAASAIAARAAMGARPDPWGRGSRPPPDHPIIARSPPKVAYPSRTPAATGRHPAATGRHPVATHSLPVATHSLPVATRSLPTRYGSPPGRYALATGRYPLATHSLPVATHTRPLPRRPIRTPSTRRYPITTCRRRTSESPARAAHSKCAAPRAVSVRHSRNRPTNGLRRHTRTVASACSVLWQ
jgi:hypothetical protein